MARELVLYVSGGAMSGVFSMGVLSALEDSRALARFDALYGASAGAYNVACFAAGDVRAGLRWYYELVRKHSIIRTRNPVRVLSGTYPIDLQEGERVLRTYPLINFAALRHSRRFVGAKVLSYDTRRIRYLDLRTGDQPRKLAASAALTPFVEKPVTVEGKVFVDGAIGEIFGLARLRKRHPAAAFVVIANARYADAPIRRALLHYVTRRLDPALDGLQERAYDAALREMKAMRKADDVLYIEPQSSYPVYPFTLDQVLLERGFRAGRHAFVDHLPELRRLFDGKLVR